MLQWSMSMPARIAKPLIRERPRLPVRIRLSFRARDRPNLAMYFPCTRWLGVVGAYMQRTRPDFWADVKNCTGCPADFPMPGRPVGSPPISRIIRKFPLQFLAAGHDGRFADRIPELIVGTCGLN